MSLATDLDIHLEKWREVVEEKMIIQTKLFFLSYDKCFFFNNATTRIVGYLKFKASKELEAIHIHKRHSEWK